LKVRLASLYGSVMRSTSWTPSSSSSSALSGAPADRAEHGARDAGRSVHVHAHLDEALDDLFDLRLGGPFFHHYDHGFFSSA
jgi:guanyl-specific ribonuclease Sa